LIQKKRSDFFNDDNKKVDLNYMNQMMAENMSNSDKKKNLDIIKNQINIKKIND
jgi:hypothetical protein